MNEKNFIYDENMSMNLWCPNVGDASDLARFAEYAIANNAGIVSVVPVSVGVLWPWLEKTGIKIMGRFYLPAHVDDKKISDLVCDVNTVFRQGGSGAQIFMGAEDIEKFANNIRSIRDDLFFNKDLTIGLDVGTVGPFDWGHVFDVMIRLRTTSIMLVLTRDSGGKSDFVGRVYAALNAWNSDFRGEIHWMVGNNIRPEQVLRLTAVLHPELVARTRFFISQ